MKTLNISKSNPLNFVYKLWLSFGGQPKTPEDLCHFMRVCMFFWWMRWLFSAGRYNPDFPKDRHREPIGERFPRVMIFVLFFVAMCVVIGLINEGVLLSTALLVLIMIIGACVLGIFIVGTVKVSKRISKYEAVETFKDYLSARKQRICPFIEVEK